MYKVSILVPIYNTEKYIEKCAVSLYEQTYQNIEYIFIDDGSKDNTLAILKKVIQRYPNKEKDTHLIIHSVNQGIAASRNEMMEKATGEFVFFVDSDDYLEYNAIQLMVECQTKTKADLVNANYILHVHDYVQKVTPPVGKDKEGFTMSMLGTDIYHFMWNRLIRRSLITEHHIIIPDGCNLGEDQYVMGQLAYYSKTIQFIDDFTYHYEFSNNLSAREVAGKNFTENNANSIMKSIKYVKTFFADKEKQYYQKACITEFHLLFYCLSTLCRFNKRKDYSNIYHKYGHIEIPNAINPIKRIFFRLIFSDYYLMSIYLKVKKK